MVSGTTSVSGSDPLACYDGQAGIDGNFSTVAFDSVDINPDSTAGRMFQGGSLTGGGANTFVLSNGVFSSSESGSPGFNFGGVNEPDQAAAFAAGDSFSFTVEAN